ncbi:hypothetical protein CFC21_018446 [Triticum aestivum]|uniref:NAC domain-containing protein n=2 Tax=Triticum aestivum TaxID=4565 RepID=A0A9R1E3K5_WHEAT|nr:uncharacterized protein LOC123185859 [Triticum aestivum]KAF7003066.1 hypothetical protein CFC21_018446 [Triticum aestivum]
MKYPVGFRFAPTDEELVEYYLLPRLQGRQHVPNLAIIQDNVYQCHPDDLVNGKYKDKGQDNNWFFLTSRTRKYVNGGRPARTTDDGRGRWKASTGTTEVVGATVTYKESGLAYHEGPIKTERKTKWLMHELTVPEYENKLDKSGVDRPKTDTLDEYVMCRIYVTPRKRKRNDDEAGPSGTPEEFTCLLAASPELGPVETAGPKLSERQAGKRPVEPEQPLDRCFGPQDGMQVRRFGTATGYPHGGTGLTTMAYNPHTSMARPPVAFTGQMPASGAAAPPHGYFAPATMMGRHLGAPSSQAFGPPLVTLARRPQMMQKQPETEEMRQKRAYQQHVDEMVRCGMSMMQQPGDAAHAAQQPRPMASMKQKQQQPYFGDGVNNHRVAPQFLPCNNQSVQVQNWQCSWAVPADSGATTVPATVKAKEVAETGAANEGADVNGDCNSDSEKRSVEAETKGVFP